MKREFQRKRYFKNQLRLLAAAFVCAPAAVFALTLLCLGRGLLSQSPGQSQGEQPALTVELPLSAPLEEEGAAEEQAAGFGETGQAGQAENGQAASEGEAALWDQSVTLSVLVGDQVQEMTLGDYLWGVVAAEMPANFHEEALKAQAAAARTYTVYKLLHPSGAHEADLCSDPGCCQAWMSREDRMAAWDASEAEALSEKVTRAVTETDGMAVCYGGEPIQAVFHAASDGTTRSAQEVWGTEVAYLQSVTSPEGEEVPNYYSTVQVSASDFAAAVTGAVSGCDLSGAVESWIGEVRYDEAGLSEAVVIGGVEVPTSTLRTLFSLRSSSLTLEAAGDTVTFYVTGYGHGVGMSQYGANALAGQGKGWQEILTWYYSGTAVENLADKALDLG